MNDTQIWWYVARATGLVAWGLITTSVIGGMMLSTRLTGGRPTPGWLQDVHRFLGGLAVIFTGFHLLGLVADNFVDFGFADLFVPLASSWQRVGVALGVVALYLLLAVEVTSLLMRRIPRSWWKRVHVTSYALFWFATIHLVSSGTDASNPAMRWSANLAMAAVVFLTLVRVWSPRGRRAARTAKPGLNRAPSPGSEVTS
jgi:DMSO/TMAO reductase YedYZ heme-binding membrane subunit